MNFVLKNNTKKIFRLLVEGAFKKLKPEPNNGNGSPSNGLISPVPQQHSSHSHGGSCPTPGMLKLNKWIENMYKTTKMQFNFDSKKLEGVIEQLLPR